MELEELKEKLTKLPGILALVVDSDVVIDNERNIYIKKRIDSHKKPRLLLNERLLLPCFPIESYVHEMVNLATESVLAFHQEKRNDVNTLKRKQEIEAECLKEQWTMIGILIASITPIMWKQINHSINDYNLRNKK